MWGSLKSSRANIRRAHASTTTPESALRGTATPRVEVKTPRVVACDTTRCLGNDKSGRYVVWNPRRGAEAPLSGDPSSQIPRGFTRGQKLTRVAEGG